MGFFLAVHHIGTILLLVTAIILMVASITAPQVNSLALLKVRFPYTRGPNGINFGSFGYCIFSTNEDDYCQRSLGYNPLSTVRAIDGRVDYGSVGRHTASGLTRAMVLHPVGAILAFIAFLLALVGTNAFAAVASGVLALLTFVVTVVAVACDFTALSIVRHRVNELRGSRARYGSGLWCVVAAVVTSFVAAVIVLLTCCAGRRSKKNRQAKDAAKAEADAANANAGVDGPAPKKKFWQRR